MHVVIACTDDATTHTDDATRDDVANVVSVTSIPRESHSNHFTILKEHRSTGAGQ